MNLDSHPVYRFYCDVISAGDTTRIEELFTEDFTLYGDPGAVLSPEKVVGRDAFTEQLSSFLDTFGVDVNVEEVLQQDNTVSALLTVNATLKKEFLGLALGSKATYSALNFFRLEGDKIAEEWQSEDFVGMLIQLGCKLYDPNGKLVV